MQTLAFGRKKPDDGDKGTIFFDALEDNIVLDDAHSHNGTDSPKLTSAASTAVVQTLLAASWAVQPSGLYRQTVTMPGVIQYDTHTITFRDSTTKRNYWLTTEYVSANSYYVYINDSSKEVLALYT